MSDTFNRPVSRVSDVLSALTWSSLVHDLFVFEIPKDVDYNIIYRFNIIS